MEALSEATLHISQPTLRKVAEEIKLSLESGIRLSDAFKKHSQLFPPAVIHLIRMGEEGGLLDQTLMSASAHVKNISRIVIDVKKALIYPAFALTATMFAMIFWLNYTVPSLSELYTQMQVELPKITQVVINISVFVKSYIYWLLLALVILIGVFRFLLKYKYRVRLLWHRVLLKIPVVKKVLEYANISFIFEYFSMLTRAGIDMYSTLGIIADSLQNEVYRKVMMEVRDKVTKGGGVANALAEQPRIPGYVSRMVRMGESSGNLDEQLEYIAEDYREKLTDTIDRLKTMIEPIAIVFIGGLMLVIIIALFFPIYQLIGNISVRGA